MRTSEQIRDEYEKWLSRIQDAELLAELKAMGDSAVEDAFYRDSRYYRCRN